MKKIIGIMSVIAMLSAITALGQSLTGGRGTIRKDITYFDNDGNLVIPKITAGTITVQTNLTVSGTITNSTFVNESEYSATNIVLVGNSAGDFRAVTGLSKTLTITNGMIIVIDGGVITDCTDP